MIKWKYKPSGWCPVQSEGHFLGYYFYFRARGEHATIDFAKTENNWKKWEYVKEYELYTTTYPKARYLNKYFC